MYQKAGKNPQFENNVTIGGIKMKFKKLTALLLTAALGMGVLTACSGDETSSDGENLTYVSLRINPEIELIADGDGVVLSANAVNEDGEILLTAVDVIGIDVEDATLAFAEGANELGYVVEGETDTVYIGVEGTSESETEEIKEKINKSIRDYFTNNGINGKVSAETLDKYAERAESWGISKGHTKLVMRALDANPELTDQEVLKLSIKEIMNLIKGDKYEEKIAVGLREEYRAAVSALKEEYKNLFTLRAEIDALEAELKETANESEKADIKAEIEAKEAELKPIEKEYKDDFDEIKNTYKELSKEARKAYEAEAKKRQDEAKKNKDK